MTHITFETAKKLKEFLKDKAPEPMVSMYFWNRKRKSGLMGPFIKGTVDESEWEVNCPAYQLHDLLSKPFCEAFCTVLYHRTPVGVPYDPIADAYDEAVIRAYRVGGLPAVEKALTEMMEGK